MALLTTVKHCYGSYFFSFAPALVYSHSISGAQPNMGPAAKSSVKELVQGRLALYMWGRAGVCGVLVPLLTISYMYLDHTQPGILLGASALGILLGVFSLTYCMLKAGVYRPLTPTAF